MSLPDLDTLFLAQRVDGPELLDEGQGSEEEAQGSLNDLRRLNHFLFGVHVTLHTLEPWLRESPKPTSVLELGTGSGQMAQALARWAAREYQAVRVMALDLMPRHLAHASRWSEALETPHVLLVGGDAQRLPLPDQSIDYVISSLFLHHFDELGLTALFEECRRVARRGLVMSDLWRHPLPFYLYKGIAEPLLVRSPLTFADSTASFRRAYRPEEMARIASAILPDARISLHFPSFRWRLTSRWA